MRYTARVASLAFALLAFPIAADFLVLEGCRQSSFAIIPDTQHLDENDELIAIPLMQDWIWARRKDCSDGIPRDDSTASGCINWMGNDEGWYDYTT